ncbi:hypothetical protein ALC62_00076, partial [Cyphomyrmex costatus]
WITHEIMRILGTSNTYESGIEKVKLAQDYSDLDISDKDISSQKRISRSKKVFRIESSSSSDNDQNNNISDESEQVNKKKALGAPPPLPKSFITNKSTNETMQRQEIHTNNANKNMTTEASVTLHTPGKNMLPEILRRLNQIFVKVSSIDDRLYKLEENQNHTQRNKEILDEFVALPLKTDEELQNMEKDLENKDFFEQMVNTFYINCFKVYVKVILYVL